MAFNTNVVVFTFLITIVFVAFSSFLFGMATSYNVTPDDEYQDIFNMYNDTYEISSDVQTTLEGGDINPEGQDQAVYSDVIVAGKGVMKSGKLFQKTLLHVPKIFGIDVTIISIVIALIAFLSAMAFLKMITKESA